MAKTRIDPNQGRKGDAVSVRGDILEFDDDPEKILGKFSKELEDFVRDALNNPQEAPSPATVKRRGDGRLWRVTGRLINEIKGVWKAGEFMIVGPTGRIFVDFVKQRLFQTTPLEFLERELAGRGRLGKALSRGTRDWIRVIRKT